MRRRSDIAYGRLLLGSDLKALFSKVLCCAGVIGNISDGRGESEIKVCALAVLLCDSIGVVKDGGHEGVDGILGDGVAGEKNSADCDGGCILRQTVGVGRDGVLGVVGGLCEEQVDVLVVKGDEVDALAGSKVGDSGGGGACNDEACVDLAILQALSAVAKTSSRGRGYAGVGLL